MQSKVTNILVLCTGNSARSVLAEAIFNRAGNGRVRGFSAGSHPRGRVHPQALALLGELGHDVSSLRSKSWDEFAAAGAPVMDFIITVCDDAAGEVCPVWPGHPAVAHWGLPDPAAVTGGAEQRAAFAETYRRLSTRIEAFLALPLASLEGAALKAELQKIGELRD